MQDSIASARHLAAIQHFERQREQAEIVPQLLACVLHDMLSRIGSTIAAGHETQVLIHVYRGNNVFRSICNVEGAVLSVVRRLLHTL
jgi:hypothetical protein